jgi:diadenosine tetraphosphate (Ap4A) HIT family hydrolase
MNATLAKFGLPGTLIREYRHWCVLLRPAQVTLASLVLGAKGEERAFSELSPEAFTELGTTVHDIEHALKAFRSYDRINYLMLMMADPHVHFHVVPRYAQSENFDGVSFADAGWPGPPDLKSATDAAEPTRARLLQSLRQCWPKT